jgi:hypothetical protein
MINQALMLELAPAAQREIERQCAVAVIRHTELAREPVAPRNAGALAHAWPAVRRGVHAVVGKHARLTPLTPFPNR